MLQRRQVYECGPEQLWQRGMGLLSPLSYARQVGGSQDLIKRLQLYAKLDGHDGCVNTVQFNPSGDILVSGSDDMKIVLWDWAAKLKRLAFSSGHVNNVFQARIMPMSDDRCIVSCAADGQVRLAEILEDGEVHTKKLAEHKGRAHKLAIEPGSPRIFLSCGEDGIVRHFDIRDESSKALLKCYRFASSSREKRSALSLNTIVINPINPHYFAVGGADEYARVYDIRRVPWDKKIPDEPVDTFVPKHLMGHNHVHITCVAFSHQEELLTSYNDELIYLFQKTMGIGPTPMSKPRAKECEQSSSTEGPQVYKGHRNTKTVKGVNFFGPNAEYVVSGSDCGRIFIWKKKGGELVSLLLGDKQIVNCLEPHPHATILATSGIEKKVKVWCPTAAAPSPLPNDAEKIMEQNAVQRDGRTRLSLTPDVIMYLLQLQRRHEGSELNRQYLRADYNSDNDGSHDEYMDLCFSDSDDADDNSGEPANCLIN